ncbi:MAG: peptidoglycan editing factor PgeF [Gammaproteobacteria bacterium]|jgi:YfiH family protein|nr:peptidoglycan editing factor PgeF [Gammaproteobacteria bacterium]
MKVIEPDWPVERRVGAFTTTRDGGVSVGPWASLNLGVNSGDEADAVAANRGRLTDELPAEPRWLGQVHGSRVIHLADWQPEVEADAAWTDRPGEAVVIQTADCLPVLLAARDGSLVAGVHGGWRSLAAGIIERTLWAVPVPGKELRAWIGPGICARCYQVGGEVRSAFVDLDPVLAAAFQADGDRWRADLKWIAAQQLRAAGVEVFDCRRCTFEEVDTFYSFRREGRTGRLASVIWMSEEQ